MKKINSIDKFLIIATIFLSLMLFATASRAQEVIIQPDYGLATSATGFSICAIGFTMKTSAVPLYSQKYGYNYVNYHTPQQARLRLHTLVLGATIVIAGIIIRNRKNKNH